MVHIPEKQKIAAFGSAYRIQVRPV